MRGKVTYRYQQRLAQTARENELRNSFHGTFEAVSKRRTPTTPEGVRNEGNEARNRISNRSLHDNPSGVPCNLILPKRTDRLCIEAASYLCKK